MEISEKGKKYVTTTLIISLAFVIWSLVYLVLGEILTNSKIISLLVLLVLAVAAEIKSVRTSNFGFASAGFALYFAAIINGSYAEAVLIASIAIGCRELFTSKNSPFAKVTEISIGVISVGAAGITYFLINNIPIFTQFTVILNIAGIIFSGLIYYLLDHFLNKLAAEIFLSQEKFADYKIIRKSIKLYLYSIAPLGILMASGGFFSPLLYLLGAPVIYSILNTIDGTIKDLFLEDQDKLLSKINILESSLISEQEKCEEISTILEAKANEQAILLEVGEALGASVSLISTLEIVVSMIRKLVPFQSCVIFLIDKKTGTLVAPKSITPYRDILENSSLLQLEESTVKIAIERRKPLLMSNMQPSGEQRIFKDERSLICVPLIVKNEILGVIYVGSVEPNAYNNDHKHLLEILANAASNAIRISQLYDQRQEDAVTQKELAAQLSIKVENSRKLLDIGQKLSSSLNLEEAQKIIIEGMESMLSCQSAAVFLIRESSASFVKTLVPTKFRSPYGQIFEDMQISINDQSNIMGWIAHYHKPQFWEDTRNLRLETLIQNERSGMVVPMIVENEIIGALYVGDSNPKHFKLEDLEQLEMLAHNSAMALKNAEIYENTARKAITDGLTGLNTHRYFQERLEEEIKNARRQKIYLALLMIDADHFKSYNDTLGHPEGDKVLKTISDLIRTYTRESDLVCRIGGDEFTVLLKDIDKKNAMRKAEGIRQAVQSKFHDHKVKITTSIGIATFPDDGDSKKPLIAAADAALYKSKKLGRNRVSIATGPVSANFVQEPLPRE